MSRATGFRLGNDVQAGIAGHQRIHLRFGYADEDDGLGMLDQLDTDNPGVRADRDERMDWLTGIAGGPDEVRCHEDPGHRLAALQHRRHR